MGAEEFGMSLETRETKLFWRDIPGFCRDIPEVPEKFEKKKVWVQFSFPILAPGEKIPTQKKKLREFLSVGIFPLRAYIVT